MKERVDQKDNGDKERSYHLSVEAPEFLPRRLFSVEAKEFVPADTRDCVPATTSQFLPATTREIASANPRQFLDGITKLELRRCPQLARAGFHKFHRGCIDSWVGRSTKGRATCPLCRQHV